jgi:hypothetical protein
MRGGIEDGYGEESAIELGGVEVREHFVDRADAFVFVAVNSRRDDEQGSGRGSDGGEYGECESGLDWQGLFVFAGWKV